MKEIKLIQTLMTFSKSELKDFEKFIASAYFNKGRNYLPVFKSFKSFYPDFDNVKLNSENIYSLAFPGRKFNKQVMWNMISGLEKLALEFLLQISLKGNNIESNVLMFQELSKRNLDKELYREINKTDVKLNSMKSGKDYYSLKYISENNKAEYWNLIKGRQDKSLEGTVNSTELLLLNFLIDVSIQVWDLHILKIMYSSGRVIDSAMEMLQSIELKELITAAERNKSKYFPVMEFYYNKIMCAVDDKSERYFFEMKKYFEEHYAEFDLQEQRNTIITLANFCAHKMRLGDEKFLRILFQLNCFRLEHKIETYRNGRINKAMYHQVLRNALSLGEIKWAEEFVRQYTSKLRKEHQKTMRALASGYIYYAKKEYEKSLAYLNSVELIDLRDKLHIRILASKAYYELDKTELLFYHIDSSKHFISNSQDIDNNTRDAYLKYFTFLKRLLQCRENPSLKNIRSLKTDVHLDSVIRIRHKEWLEEKIEFLQNNLR